MTIEILMPALSPTMTEGTLASWLKKEGDKVEPGDVIAEIETDKATMEVESIDEGTLGKILIPAGSENVPVNTVIALLLEEGEDKKALAAYKPAKPEPVAEVAEEPAEPAAEAVAPAAQAPAPTAAPSAPTVAPQAAVLPLPSSGEERVKASPVAKRVAAQAGIDISALIGSGPKGRIIKSDVEDAVKRGGVSGVVRRNPVELEQVPNSGMRKVIARRLSESKQQIPHFYLSLDCNIDKLLEARKDLNDKAAEGLNEEEKPTYKLSVNDFIIKATALALKKIPQANASWYDDAIVLYNNVDIAIAVATDGGLITPIIRNADQKSLPAISSEMKDLAARARSGGLAPEEYQGGGFSISNLGMYGIKTFSAIINPPQSCILAVGAGEQQTIVKNGKIEIATVMSVTLSVDHRSVDGAVGAQFLNAFKGYINSPITMFV